MRRWVRVVRVLMNSNCIINCLDLPSFDVIEHPYTKGQTWNMNTSSEYIIRTRILGSNWEKASQKPRCNQSWNIQTVNHYTQAEKLCLICSSVHAESYGYPPCLLCELRSSSQVESRSLSDHRIIIVSAIAVAKQHLSVTYIFYPFHWCWKGQRE